MYIIYIFRSSRSPTPTNEPFLLDNEKQTIPEPQRVRDRSNSFQETKSRLEEKIMEFEASTRERSRSLSSSSSSFHQRQRLSLDREDSNAFSKPNAPNEMRNPPGDKREGNSESRERLNQVKDEKEGKVSSEVNFISSPGKLLYTYIFSSTPCVNFKLTRSWKRLWGHSSLQILAL